MIAANKRTTDMNPPPATAPTMAATGVEEVSEVDGEGEVSEIDEEGEVSEVGAKKKKGEGESMDQLIVLVQRNSKVIIGWG